MPAKTLSVRRLFAGALTLLLTFACTAVAEDELPPGAVARIHVGAEDNSIWCLAAFPDGRTLVITDYADNVLLWDLETGQVIRRLATKQAFVESIAVRPDSRQIAWSVWEDEPIVLLDLPLKANSRSEPRSSRLKTEDVSEPQWMFYSPDGQKLVVFGDGSRAVVWTPETGHIWKYGRPASAAVMSRNGKVLALGYNEVQLVNADDGSLIRELSTVEGITSDLAFLPGDRLVAADSSCRGSKVRIWNWKSGEQLAAWDPALRTGHLSNLAVSPDGKLLVTKSDDGRLCFIDLTTRQTRALIRTRQRGGISFLEFVADGTRLVTVSDGDRDAIVWDVGQVLEHYVLPASKPARAAR